MKTETIQELINNAKRCECDSFIEGDPVQFPHRYSSREDIEASAFISAWMAYGSRKVFLGVLDRMHRMMDAAGGPYRYIVSESWRYLSNEGCLYRFYKWADFGMLCQRLASVYSRMDSLENLFVPGEPLEKGVLCLCCASTELALTPLISTSGFQTGMNKERKKKRFECYCHF